MKYLRSSQYEEDEATRSYELKKAYKHKTKIISTILLIKSSFGIIDQMFQQEIMVAQERKKNKCTSSCCIKQSIEPTKINEFIEYIMDPFDTWSKPTEFRMDIELVNEVSRKIKTAANDHTKLKQMLRRNSAKIKQISENEKLQMRRKALELVKKNRRSLSTPGITHRGFTDTNLTSINEKK